MDFISTAITYAQQYPLAFAVALGLLFGMAVAQGFSMVFLPDKLTALEKFRITSVVDVLATHAFIRELVKGLDPHAQEHYALNSVLSFGFAFSAPVVRMLTLKVLKKRWPWLDLGDDSISSTPQEGSK